jgi:hypothetical protein
MKHEIICWSYKKNRKLIREIKNNIFINSLLLKETTIFENYYNSTTLIGSSIIQQFFKKVASK